VSADVLAGNNVTAHAVTFTADTFDVAIEPHAADPAPQG
jgi:hypothetical protein